jgi:hypothetical protein
MKDTQKDNPKGEEVLMVTCRKHGKRPSGIICRHLNGAIGLGFYRPGGNEDHALQAWCHNCEKRLTEIGEWPNNKETLDNFTTVCDRCFAKVEAENHILKIYGHTVH